VSKSDLERFLRARRAGATTPPTEAEDAEAAKNEFTSNSVPRQLLRETRRKVDGVVHYKTGPR
jgi:hypothetical protein